MVDPMMITDGTTDLARANESAWRSGSCALNCFGTLPLHTQYHHSVSRESTNFSLSLSFFSTSPLLSLLLSS